MLPWRGFSTRWRDWIALILSTTTSKVMLNGTTWKVIMHKRGLRQGDPLSPYLFILAIDPLQTILDMAKDQGILSPISNRVAKFRTSLYADDAAIFLNPSRADVDSLITLLENFGRATGLQVNLSKSSVVPIRCENIDLQDVLNNFNGKRTNWFPHHISRTTFDNRKNQESASPTSHGQAPLSTCRLEREIVATGGKEDPCLFGTNLNTNILPNSTETPKKFPAWYGQN